VWGRKICKGKREDSLGEGDREEAVNRDCWEKESDLEKDRSMGEREKWVGGKKKIIKKRKVVVGIRVCRFLFFIVSRTYNGIINWALLN
jgi:hypothetical protein